MSTTSETVSVPAPPPAADLSLSEMLHVLDVARTLRRDQELVESELNKEELLASLRERLLAAAAAAGDNVTEAEVDTAIELYFDSLHKYADPPLGVSVVLAHLYVLRKQVAIAIGVFTAVLLVAWGLFWSPTAPFSSEARRLRSEDRDRQVIAHREQAIDAAIESYTKQLALARGIAEQPRAVDELDRLAREGEAAVSARDVATVEHITAEVAAIDSRMREVYEILIVADLDRRSGVIRDFDNQLSGYYVVVEAHAPDGRILPMDITNRETGATSRVSEWGELVPEDVFERIRQDKGSDGVLDERTFAQKRRGWLDVEVVLPGTDGLPLSRTGQISDW